MSDMMMVVDISAPNRNFNILADELEVMGEKIGVIIKIQHAEIFNSMHRI